MGIFLNSFYYYNVFLKSSILFWLRFNPHWMENQKEKLKWKNILYDKMAIITDIKILSILFKRVIVFFHYKRLFLILSCNYILFILHLPLLFFLIAFVFVFFQTIYLLMKLFYFSFFFFHFFLFAVIFLLILILSLFHLSNFLPSLFFSFI